MSNIPKVILLIEKSRAFGKGLITGIVQYSNLCGPWLFYMEPDFYMTGSVQPYKWMKDLDADGIIAHTWDVDIIQNIIDSGLPAMICGINKPVSNTYCLVTDENAVGRMAAEYFLKHGFTRFAFCGFDNMIWSKRRGESFCRTIAEYGLKTCFYQQPEVKHSLNEEEEQKIIAQWLQLLPKPVAIMACNDDKGRDVLAACKIADFKVPNDVAILGVDDDELICSLSYPQLSSIAVSTETAGYEAAKILDKLMNGKEIAESEKEVSISPVHVVTRHSTDIMAIEDQQIAEAVNYIRKHSKNVIQVGNVAEAVGLSRRTLEQRFRKILAHSVHEEITYARVNHMADILINTNMSVSRIARLLGYPYANNISRYFKKQKGMSPSEYRKKFSPK